LQLISKLGFLFDHQPDVGKTMARLNWVTVAVLVASEMSGPSRAQELPSQVEEIRIVRSVRLSRDPATGFCNAERTGFEGAESEDQYDFRVVITRASDGMVVNATSVPIGELHACFGPSSDPEVTNFFGRGTLAGVTFAGRGDCRLTKRHFPEQGMLTYRCFLDLRGLPEGYIGVSAPVEF